MILKTESPDFQCIVQERKEGSEGKGAGEHGNEAELDDHLQVLSDDHGGPGGGQEEVLKIISDFGGFSIIDRRPVSWSGDPNRPPS